ncbi:hypothetical protein D3C86_1196510 [compost metagenome]
MCLVDSLVKDGYIHAASLCNRPSLAGIDIDVRIGAVAKSPKTSKVGIVGTNRPEIKHKGRIDVGKLSSFIKQVGHLQRSALVVWFYCQDIP